MPTMAANLAVFSDSMECEVISQDDWMIAFMGPTLTASEPFSELQGPEPYTCSVSVPFSIYVGLVVLL